MLKQQVYLAKYHMPPGCAVLSSLEGLIDVTDDGSKMWGGGTTYMFDTNGVENSIIKGMPRDAVRRFTLLSLNGMRYYI